MNTQYKKGVLDICVLALLYEKKHYGYEIVQKVANQIDIAEGTIYPLLKRLKENKYVTTFLEESLDGPPRKYYEITDLGKSDYLKQKHDWMDFIAKVNKLLDKSK
jgi:PadR family transcriptional regulator PadR